MMMMMILMMMKTDASIANLCFASAHNHIESPPLLVHPGASFFSIIMIIMLMMIIIIDTSW